MSPSSHNKPHRAPAHSDTQRAGERGDRPQERDDAKLDRAIKGTFPASDPIATGQSTGDDDSPRGRVDRKTPPIDHGLVERLAKDVRRDTE